MKKKITCPGCNAVYNIPINKLHKEVSRTTCRKCGHKIEVRKPSSSDFLVKDSNADKTMPTAHQEHYDENEDENAYKMSPFSTEQFPPNPFEDDNAVDSPMLSISPNEFQSDFQNSTPVVDNSVTKPSALHSSPIAAKTTQTSHYRGFWAMIGFAGLLGSFFLPDMNSIWYTLIALGLSIPFFNALWPQNNKKIPSLMPILALSLVVALIFGGGHYLLQMSLNKSSSQMTVTADVTEGGNTTGVNTQELSQNNNEKNESEQGVVDANGEEKSNDVEDEGLADIKNSNDQDVVDVDQKSQNQSTSQNESKSITRLKSKHRAKRSLDEEEENAPKADPYKFKEGALQQKTKQTGEESLSNLDQKFAAEQQTQVNNTEIPQSVIHTMLHNNKGIFACYREHRSLTGQYPSGVKIRFEVTSSGNIPKAFIVDGPFVGSRFEVCLRKAMREIVFPPTQGGSKEYEYKFLL